MSTRNTAIEQLVSTFTLEELARHAGCSVESIVSFAMNGSAVANGPTPQSTPRTKPANKPSGRIVDTRTADARETYTAAVLEAVRTANGPIGSEALRKAVGGTSLQLRTALKRLIDDKKVRSRGKARATTYAAR